MKLGYFVFIPVLILPYFVQAKVFINEIAWMGSLPKDGETLTVAANNEWIELYNDGSEPVDLTGWILFAEDGTPIIKLEKSIGAGSYFLLERTDDESVPKITADLIYVGALGNSGEVLTLKDSNNSIVDKVNSYGEWLAGDNTTKETMQRVGENWITSTLTPRAPNIGFSPSAQESKNKSDADEDEVVISNNHATAPVVKSNIKAYAGEDKIAVVGSPVEFRGFAFGLNNEPIDKGRFWWNFGDGNTKEGRSIVHIFKIPGKYTVGLHVSEEYFASSDFLSIDVIPNKLYVKNVVVGEDGFIQFANPDNNVIDIGSWIIEDFKKESFTIPVKTVIGAKSEIAFANDTTGLFKKSIDYPIVVRYANLKEAFKYPLKKEETAENPANKKAEYPVQKIQVQTSISAKTPNASEIKKPYIIDDKKDDNVKLAEIKEAFRNQSDKKLTDVLDKNSFNPNLFFWSAFILSIVSAAGFFVVKKFYF